MLPPLAIIALGATALWLLRRHQGTVVAGGPPGTIVDVSPMLGVKHVQISAGQTVRVNLPREWIILSAVGPSGEIINQANLPMQPVPARHLGGLVFTAAMPGKETVTFTKQGSTDTFDVTFDISPMMADHAAGAWRVARPLPYREYWSRQQANPWWRWREEQWRLHRHWQPAWGPPPPPPADPVADVVDATVTADASV